MRICDIVNHIFAIQALDKDLFKCVILLNSLSSPQYEPLQAQISRGLANAIASALYKSDSIWKLLETVQNLTTLKASSNPLATNMALTTTARGHPSKPWLLGHTHYAGAKLLHNLHHARQIVQWARGSVLCTPRGSHGK